ncbi:MAG TPA: Wzz/FepE/Etk N-terminal domain-containing protein, partial [Bacteroidia bacterium]|nr:Wzz/FepE/Etk N-terminal domain-containing protein [Bacteroidia bacterium]
MLADKFSSKSDAFSQYKQRVSNLSSEFEIGLFFFLLRKQLWLIFLFFLIALSIAFLYLRYTPQVFQAKSIVQVNNENQASRILNVENINEGSNDIAKSIELLRSKVFFKRVLSTLPLHVTYFAEGTFRANEHYKLNSFTVEATEKSPAILGVKIYIHFDNAHAGEIRYALGGGKPKAYKFIPDKVFSTPELDAKVTITNYSDILSQQNLVKENSLYFIINDMDALTNQYFPNLSVRLLNDAAKTIEISFADNSPLKTKDVVVAMASEFIDYDIEKKGESSKKVLNFLEDQLNFVYERLRSTETSLFTFRKDNKVNESSKNFADAGAVRLNALEDDLIALELKENVLNEVEKNIDEKKSVDTYQLISQLLGADFESSLNTQILSLQSLLKNKEELLYEVTPTSEKIKSIEFQIGVQKRLLIESIKSIRNKLLVRKTDMEAKIKEMEAKYYSIPAEEVEYSRLQRLYAINEKFYNLLLEKKTEYSISEAGNVSQHIVLDNALVPQSPISPSKSSVLLTTLLIALLISLLLTFAKYITYDQINSVNEINKLTDSEVSILGIVPKYKKDIPVSQLLVDKNPKSLIAEAFRSIRTNLQFISNKPGTKIAVVTSTVSGEGKTFVAINLAGIVAYSGKRVIVIDLDMRKPKIHLGFGVENHKGMSTLLIGKDILENCIQKSNFDGLDFITAG